MDAIKLTKQTMTLILNIMVIIIKKQPLSKDEMLFEL